MTRMPMQVLGIDTSLRSSGYGVVSSEGNRMSAVEYGAIRIHQKKKLSECLTRLGSDLAAVIERVRPDAVAIEGAFFFENARTALVLGEARGVAIATCASKGIPVYEYAPRRVKQAVVGNGSASKEQVRKMVMRLLALNEEPQEDAGDALAIAICHLNNRTSVAGLQPETI